MRQLIHAALAASLATLAACGDLGQGLGEREEGNTPEVAYPGDPTLQAPAGDDLGEADEGLGSGGDQGLNPGDDRGGFRAELTRDLDAAQDRIERLRAGGEGQNVDQTQLARVEEEIAEVRSEMARVHNEPKDERSGSKDEVRARIDKIEQQLDQLERGGGTRQPDAG